MAVTGLDLSMTSTGIARIRQSLDGVRLTTDVVKSKGKRSDTLEDRALRIKDLRQRIVQHVTLQDTLVMIESPSYGSAGSGTWDRAGLWWGVVSWLIAHDVPVAMVAPTTLKKWITGNGRADKKAVQEAVAALFPDLKASTNDECDAASMAHLGAFCMEFADLPIVEGRHTEAAMAAVKWPASLTGGLGK